MSRHFLTVDPGKRNFCILDCNLSHHHHSDIKMVESSNDIDLVFKKPVDSLLMRVNMVEYGDASIETLINFFYNLSCSGSKPQYYNLVCIERYAFFGYQSVQLIEVVNQAIGAFIFALKSRELVAVENNNIILLTTNQWKRAIISMFKNNREEKEEKKKFNSLNFFKAQVQEGLIIDNSNVLSKYKHCREHLTDCIFMSLYANNLTQLSHSS